MKKQLLIGLVISLFLSCKKDMPEPPTETTNNSSNWYSGPSSYNTYNITFFTTHNSGTGAISVNCGGQTGLITYYFNYNPGCHDPGCANFEVPPGTYYYTSSSGRSGTIKTGGVQCITIQV